MRVMLVCHFFPPQNSIGARRPYSWFRQWTESGHEVSVLTTRKTAIDGPFEDFVPGAAFKERVVEVDYQGAWAGFMGAIMAPRRPVAAAASARPASTPPLKRVLRKVRSSLLANYGEPRSAWTRRAIAKGEEIVRGRGIEVIVSSSPPYMCHSVAAALKARFPRLLWVADFRDLWSGSHIHRGARVVEAIERVHERRTLAGADLLLTVSEPLAAHLRSLHRKPVEVVPNGIERETLEGAAAAAPRANGARRLVYTGTTYPGQDIGAVLGSVERMIREDPSLPGALEISFFGDAGPVEEKLQQFPAARAVVRLHGAVTRAEALAAQRGADGLLFVGWRDNRNAATHGVLSGKIFEYLASGVEIFVMGGPRDAEVNRLVERFGAGRGYGGGGEIDGALMRLASEGGRGAPHVARFLDEFDRGALAARAANLIESARRARAGAAQ